MISVNLLAVFYLISGVLFILALRGLSSPETSRKGNFYGIIGMALAIGVTILSVGNFSLGFIYLLRASLEFIARITITFLIYFRLKFIANFIINLYQLFRSRLSKN